MTDDRRRDSAVRAELARGAAAAEAARAQGLIDAFIDEARARGLEPVPLVATTYGGREVKTDKAGWYLRRSHALAIGTDGGYYVLSVPEVPFLGRFRGIHLVGDQPGLQVGRGGRDGDSGDLADFLARALDGL